MKDCKPVPDKMPCGHCDVGTYAYEAVVSGLATFRGCVSAKGALGRAGRCKTDPTHICYGARDFIVSIDFPLTPAVEARIMREIST